MQGYGFSVWLLPPKRINSEIRTNLRQQGIEPVHQLHLTLVTNLETRQEALLAKKTFNKKASFKIGGPASLAGKMYQFDPLYAWTVPAQINTCGKEMKFEPHLSIRYFREKCSPPDITLREHEGKGLVVIADTRSEDPSQWNYEHC